MARRLFGARSDELVFRVGTGVFAVVLIAIVAAIGVELYRQSVLSIQEFGWRFWQTDTWDPVAGDFGARPFIWGTLYSSVLALLISTPIALGIAVFISELAPSRLQRPLVFLTELLAAIPSIVYGLWGVFVLVPFVRQLQVATPEWMRSIPLFTGPPLGVGMLSAALILAIMIIPFSSSVAREVLRSVPQAQREGAYALGATRWEAIRMALFYARTGIIGAVMLGFGRALGETMAVTMVIGNNPQITWSLYAPQYTMAAVLANEFTEAADDLYLHALIEIGLVLFIITLIINGISRLFIWSMGRQRKPRLAVRQLRRRRRDHARSLSQGVVSRHRRLCARWPSSWRWCPWPSCCSTSSRRASRRSACRSSQRCPSPSASQVAAWPTPSSAR